MNSVSKSFAKAVRSIPVAEGSGAVEARNKGTKSTPLGCTLLTISTFSCDIARGVSPSPREAGES
jgi:hypothetical protein